MIVGVYGFDVQFFLYLLCQLFSQQLHFDRAFSKWLKRAFISKYSITLKIPKLTMQNLVNVQLSGFFFIFLRTPRRKHERIYFLPKMNKNGCNNTQYTIKN